MSYRAILLLNRFVTAIFGLAAVAAGAALAWHHPLWPWLALAGFILWTGLSARNPFIWLFVVPAALPVLNFSPWTGWLIINEFDLLVLGTLAGGYLRLAVDTPTGIVAPEPGARWFGAFIALLAGSAALGLVMGFADALSAIASASMGPVFSLFQGYADPMNSLRVFKSLGFALMFLPLLGQAAKTVASSELAIRLFGGGVLTGLAVVTLAVVWERMAFPGLLDFSSTYRTTAFFWEMHVGGAAIDAYLAITVPFVVWGLVAVNRFRHWLPLALLALLVGYACLTTFARGLYLAVCLPLVVLGLRFWLRRAHIDVKALMSPLWHRVWPEGWRGRAAMVLMTLLAFEVAGVLGGGTFMQERLARSGNDLLGRVEHWQHGLSLLRSPKDWLLGIGLGRLPARYAQEVPDAGFSGTVQWGTDGENPSSRRFVTLSGPATDPDVGGLFGLTQRVAVIPGAAYRVSMDVRSTDMAYVYVKVCERHLIYDGDCIATAFRVHPSDAGWQRIVMPLRGDVLTGGTAIAPRFSVISLSIVNPAVTVDISNIQLIGPKIDGQKRELITNGDFSQGLAHWFPVAQSYFIPWHIDNLYLELLIERGLLGLTLFGSLVVFAFTRLFAASAQGVQMAPYLAASMGGALLVGLTGSVLDVPRVAFLLFLVTFFSIRLGDVLFD